MIGITDYDGFMSFLEMITNSDGRYEIGKEVRLERDVEVQLDL